MKPIHFFFNYYFFLARTKIMNSQWKFFSPTNRLTWQFVKLFKNPINTNTACLFSDVMPSVTIERGCLPNQVATWNSGITGRTNDNQAQMICVLKGRLIVSKSLSTCILPNSRYHFHWTFQPPSFLTGSGKSMRLHCVQTTPAQLVRFSSNVFVRH